MGLDSVELVMEFEKYFNIRIPDREAEKMATVQDIIDVVARHLSISNNDTTLRDDVIDKIQGILIKLNFTDKPMELAGPIFKILMPLQKDKWDSFENLLELEVPKPYIKEKKEEPQSFWNKIKHGITLTPVYEWEQITVEHFAAAICSRNCSKLINPSEIKSKYEIYVAIMSITADKMGLDEYEITPEKSFTNDLGID